MKKRCERKKDAKEKKAKKDTKEKKTRKKKRRERKKDAKVKKEDKGSSSSVQLRNQKARLNRSNHENIRKAGDRSIRYSSFGYPFRH